ncbi:phage tail assembly chaperone [Xanthobacteraceae bacterium Astr-EGSB]|uniref:phage tail assembly chaperone n=1 Tax=Astrobacterium formosum TaxID=3069710 RepID=UPI0027B85867|nr:phage tail assembly chaperone [Xanthobacteraceae bacterium Astr-EGSB]
MFVHYDFETNRVVQVSHAAQPFRMAGKGVAIVAGLPTDLGGGFAIDPASLRPAVVDPICETVLAPERAARTIDRDDKTWSFCCDQHFVQFVLMKDAEYQGWLAERPPEEAWECCELVALPPPPPSIMEVKAKRNEELAATDGVMAYPPDRPQLSAEALEAWRAYRQALRDLGALASAADMIAAWPLRPGGRDAIQVLRARVNG